MEWFYKAIDTSIKSKNHFLILEVIFMSKSIIKQYFLAGAR